MPKIFFYHTPELTPTDSMPDCAIAVDVLRATTTIATVLNLGAEAVQVFSDIDRLMAQSEKWLPEKRMRAGERGGAKVEGCEYGNSPLEYTADGVKDRRLFLSTSNGTRALQRVETAPVAPHFGFGESASGCRLPGGTTTGNDRHCRLGLVGELLPRR